jgi:hypothetical protein
MKWLASLTGEVQASFFVPLLLHNIPVSQLSASRLTQHRVFICITTWYGIALTGLLLSSGVRLGHCMRSPPSLLLLIATCQETLFLAEHINLAET